MLDQIILFKDIDNECTGDFNQKDLTNTQELVIFFAFSLLDLGLILRITFNFYKLKLQEEYTNIRNHKLIMINCILLTSCIVLFTSHIQQIFTYALDVGSELNFTLQFTYIYCFNIAILISSKTLFGIVQLKYEGSIKESRIAILNHISSTLLGVATLVYFLVLLDSYIYTSDSKINQYNYVGVLIITCADGVIFSLSSWIFSRHILTLHVLRAELRKMIVVGTYFVIVSSGLRIVWILLSLSEKTQVLILILKDCHEDENKGYGWSIYLLTYNLIVNYFPMGYLILLYSPYLDQSQFRQNQFSTHTVQKNSMSLLVPSDLDTSEGNIQVVS